MKRELSTLFIGLVLTLVGVNESQADIDLYWWNVGGIGGPNGNDGTLHYAATGDWDTWGSSGSSNSAFNDVQDGPYPAPTVRRHDFVGGFRFTDFAAGTGGGGGDPDAVGTNPL